MNVLDSCTLHFLPLLIHRNSEKRGKEEEYEDERVRQGVKE